MILAYAGPVCSVNNRLQGRTGGKGRTLTAEYRAFLDGMTMAFRQQWADQPFKPDDRVAVAIDARVPARMDAQNVIKPVLDALEAAGVYQNDKQVTELHVTKSIETAPVKTCAMYVSVWESEHLADEIRLNKIMRRTS